MKLFYSALVCSAIYRTSNAAVQTDSGDRSFERQLGEVVEAKYNIEEPDMDERDMFNSLSDSDEVKVIVQTADSDRTRGANTLMAMSTKIGMKIESAGIYGLTVTKKQMEELARDPDFKYVEYDHNVSVVGDTTGHLRKLAEETPYGIDMVLQDMAFWNNLEEPSGSIKVCVADTGYDLGHVDLPKGSDVTGSNSNSNGSWDSDGHGHGTHCSGTVAGLGGNNEGVVGVIPDNAGGKFQLVIGKALSNSGSGSLSGVLEAVQSCVDDGAKVVSLSLGGGGYSKTTDEFYSNLYENDGILFVAAAGNGGSSSKLYPASYPALMSVAAIDSSKNKASFSQYNDQVEISAPGVSVKSSLPNDKYASWSGTSMATPHVAGVAGLLWMHFPECKNYQIRNVLAATALDLGSTDGCDTSFGYGLVQAKSAYELLAEGNCGGDIGTDAPTGGCEQLYPEPNCEVDSDCDDGDTCTVDTCDNGQCLSTPDCASCGKTKVDVEITIDNYGEETAYDIKDASGNKVMQGSGWPSNSVNSFWKCFSSGSYTFTITDGYGDGLCCSYGNGGYSVKVNDQEVASGGNFGSEETKTFDVASSAPTPQTPTPIAPPTSDPNLVPTFSPSTEKTFSPTTTETAIKTFAPTTTETAIKTFAPTTTETAIKTFAPTTTETKEILFPPTVTTNSPTHPPPTMHPTHTPPTMYPTHTPPTNFPTNKPPTPFPTESPPTPYPTESPPTSLPTIVCKVKGEQCSVDNDCCKKKCRKSKCKK